MSAIIGSDSTIRDSRVSDVSGEIFEEKEFGGVNFSDTEDKEAVGVRFEARVDDISEVRTLFSQGS